MSMKNFFLILVVLFPVHIWGQTNYSMSSAYIAAMKASCEIRYTGSRYSSTNYYTYNAIVGQSINARQARYDEGRAIVSNELYNLYYVLDDLLINQYNRKKWSDFVPKVKVKVPEFSKWDLSIKTNLETAVNFITQIYSWESIRAEINLIKECEKELYRIQQSNPEGYIYSKRYKAIVKTLDKLKYCQTYEINSLSWQQTELSM